MLSIMLSIMQHYAKQPRPQTVGLTCSQQDWGPSCGIVMPERFNPSPHHPRPPLSPSPTITSLRWKNVGRRVEGIKYLCSL